MAKRKPATAKAKKSPKKVLPSVEGLDGWLELDQQNKLLYRKQAIYLGDFGKLNQQGRGLEFAIARDTVEHWKRSVDELTENGIEIPFARSHSQWSDPAFRLGVIQAASVGKDSKGRDSLLLDILFDDENSRDIGLKGDISIGSPPVWFDGKKRRYEYPLQHVASTSAPVIPDLDEWQAIAASFRFHLAEGNAMDLDTLIEAMGITIPEGSDTDEAKWALILQWIEAKGGGPAEPPAEPTEEPVAASLPGVPATPAPATGGGPAKKVTATVAFSHENPPPVLVVDSVRTGRKATIDGKVAAGAFSPAAAKRLDRYLDPKVIELSIINNEDNSVFENAVADMESAVKNPPLTASGRSKGGLPPGQVELAQGQNIFMQVCEEAAAAAKK